MTPRDSRTGCNCSPTRWSAAVRSRRFRRPPRPARGSPAAWSSRTRSRRQWYAAARTWPSRSRRRPVWRSLPARPGSAWNRRPPPALPPRSLHWPRPCATHRAQTMSSSHPRRESDPHPSCPLDVAWAGSVAMSARRLRRTPASGKRALTCS